MEASSHLSDSSLCASHRESQYHKDRNLTLAIEINKNKWKAWFSGHVFLSAGLHTEGSSARAPPGRTSSATLKTAPPTPSTTEHSSVPNSTANSSEDGTTPGDHILKWMVRSSNSFHNHFGNTDVKEQKCNSTCHGAKAFSWCLRLLWFFSFLPDQDVCKLYCFAEGYDFFFALASKVKDGTLCSQDSSNVCIDGLCEVILQNRQAERQ